MLHGTSRFNIYYNCYFCSGIVIENIYVVIAGNCSIANSILHLHVLERTLRLTYVMECGSCSNCTFSTCYNPLF